MAISRNEVVELRKQLQAVMDKFSAEHGCVVTVGNASYSDTEIKFKVSVVKAGVDNNKALWDQNCVYYGLVREDYGKEIVINGEKFVVAGLKSGARKNIVLVRKVSNGQEYVISRETFIRCGGTNGFAKWEITQTAV